MVKFSTIFRTVLALAPCLFTGCSELGHAGLVGSKAQVPASATVERTSTPVPVTSATTTVPLSSAPIVLGGDVTGPIAGNQVLRVGGLDAVLVAQGATRANQATSQAIPFTIVQRDANGSFAGNLNGNATTATTAQTAVSATSAQSATSVTGIVGIANGGTGATDAAQARANLGLTNLLRLDADGKLPALDGSKLFNLSVSENGLLRVDTLALLPSPAVARQIAFVKANLCAYQFSGSRWEVIHCTHFPRWTRTGPQRITFANPNSTTAGLEVTFPIAANAKSNRHYFFGMDYSGAVFGTNFVSVEGNAAVYEPTVLERIHGQWQRCNYSVSGRSVCLPFLGSLDDTIGDVFAVGGSTDGTPDPTYVVPPAPPKPTVQITVTSYSGKLWTSCDGSAALIVACPTGTVVTSCNAWTGAYVNPTGVWQHGNGCRGGCGGGGSNDLQIEAMCAQSIVQ